VRIELRDPQGYNRSITSRDHVTITRWLGEWVPQYATLNAMYMPIQITVWAEDADEVLDGIQGARVDSTPEGMARLLKIIQGKAEVKMSNALWCDIGKHAFPEHDPLKFEFGVRGTVPNQWGGRQPTEVMKMACGACAKDSGMKKLGDMQVTDEEALNDAYSIRDRHSQPPKHIPGLPNGDNPLGADPELYTEYLENIDAFNEWKGANRVKGEAGDNSS
jgi:hypothetical protein